MSEPDETLSVTAEVLKIPDRTTAMQRTGVRCLEQPFRDAADQQVFG
jgi:hypothetical protein